MRTADRRSSRRCVRAAERLRRRTGLRAPGAAARHGLHGDGDARHADAGIRRGGAAIRRWRRALGRLVGALPLRRAAPTPCARRSRATRRSPLPRPRWRSAQDALAQARAAFYPQISAFGNAERQKTALRGNTATQSPAFNLFSLGPTVSYSPDVFGGTRRQVEQEAALAENQRYQLGGGLSHAHRQRRLAGDRHRRLPTRDRRDRGDPRRRREEPRPGACQVRGRQGRADRRAHRRGAAHERPRAAAAAAPAAQRGERRAVDPAGQVPGRVVAARVRSGPARASRRAARQPAVRSRAPASRHPGLGSQPPRRERGDRRRDRTDVSIDHPLRLGGARDLHDERHVGGDERDVEHRLGHHRPDLRGRRAGGAEAGRGRRLPRLPGDVSADRPAGLRPGRRHVAGARPRRRSGDRRAQGARRRRFRRWHCSASATRRGSRTCCFSSSPSGSTSRRDSAMPERRPSGTRIRRSCSSPWGGGGGRQGISARTTRHAADPGTKGRQS